MECVNRPNSFTILGDLDAMYDLEVLVKQEDIFTRRFKVSGLHTIRTV